MDRNLALLIQNGEAIERNLDLKPPGEKKEKQSQGKKAVKFAKAESKKELNNATYMCTVHGKNRTHNTENCYTLKTQKATAQFKAGKKTFTKKGLKNEINFLCKHTPRTKSWTSIWL